MVNRFDLLYDVEAINAVCLLFTASGNLSVRDSRKTATCSYFDVENMHIVHV